MTVELRNIPGVPAPPNFSHMSIATGDRLIHMAGQVGTDERGEVVDGLAAQAERALGNVGLILDAAEASERDLLKLTIYVVDWDPSKFEELGAGLLAAREHRSWPDVPVTVIGVSSLFAPSMLVEIEGVALCA